MSSHFFQQISALIHGHIEPEQPRELATYFSDMEARDLFMHIAHYDIPLRADENIQAVMHYCQYQTSGMHAYCDQNIADFLHKVQDRVAH